MTRGRVALTALALTLVLAACSDGPLQVLQGGAEAVCAAPEVTVDPSPVVAEEPATVSAEVLIKGCNDTGGGANTPAQGVTVSLEAVNGSWGLQDVATLDAAADLTASTTFTLASDTAPGWVNLLLDDDQYVTFEVVAP